MTGPVDLAHLKLSMLLVTFLLLTGVLLSLATWEQGKPYLLCGLLTILCLALILNVLSSALYLS